MRLTLKRITVPAVLRVIEKGTRTKGGEQLEATAIISGKDGRVLEW